MRFRIIYCATIWMLLGLTPLWSATVTVGDGESIRTAIEAADATDTIQIDSDGVFEEILFLGATETGLTIESAPGRTPVIEGNDGLNWEDSAAFPWGGILLFVDKDTTFRNLHFRIDLTGLLEIIQDNPDPEGEPAQIIRGYAMVRVQGSDATVLFDNCTFEFIGSIEVPEVLNQDTCTMSGTGTTTFNNCTWLYNHDMIDDPQANSFNTIQALVPGPELATNNVVINDGTFGALAHLGPRTGGGKGRSISTGGGGEGILNMEVNRCTFGRFRRDYRQFQQAWAYPGGTNVNLVFRGCYFPDGCGRFLGGIGNLTVRYEGCTFHHSYGGQLFLPDPGGSGVVECDNCFFTWNSNNRPGETEAIRGTNGIGFRFRHCTFVDLARENAEAFVNPDPLLMKVADDIAALEFTNCLFDVVGYTKHIVHNVFNPGQPPAINGIVASGNLINSASFPLTEGVIPPAAFAVQGDPLLAADLLHLQAGSPAIDALTSSGTDIDGEAIPTDVNAADIGADEFVGPGIVRPRRQVTYPGDVSSILEAFARANGNMDEIIITADGPFFERISTDYRPFYFTEISNSLTIRAAPDTNPMFVVDADTDWADEPGFPSGSTIAAAATAAPFATAVWVHNSISFEGIHFRIDLNDMQIINLEDFNASSIIMLRVQARQGEFGFKDCIFEAFGNPLDVEVFGMRDMVVLEGPVAADFDNCEWRYNMNLQSWPGFSNSLGIVVPVQADDDRPVLRVDIDECVFQAVADSRNEDAGGRARHIGGGGGPGEGIVTINNTIFGADRDRFNEPEAPGAGGAAGHLDGMINRQVQQAQISVAGAGAAFTVNDSTFLDGTDRQFGADTNTAVSGVFINRCILEPTTVGSAILGDPGATGFVLNNTVVRYDSRHTGDGAPIRLWGEMGDRAVQMTHCLLQDVAGVDGNPNTNVASMDDFSGLTGALSSLTNCIVDAPAMTEGVFENINAPGELPINTENPVVEGNVLNTGLLTAQIMPESGVAGRGDPALSIADGYHLTECSLVAIDRVASAGLDTDIDGDARPSGGGFDAGPDEFTGTPESPENCNLAIFGACCLVDGACSEGTEGQCDAAGGTYQGDGSNCATAVCQAGTPFRRGDHDGSGLVDITDPLNLLGFLFLGTTPPICEDASDGDNSAALDISDALNVLGFLFLGSFPLDATTPSSSICGVDQAEDFDPDGDGGFPLQPGESIGCDKYPSDVGTACP